MRNLKFRLLIAVLLTLCARAGAVQLSQSSVSVVKIDTERTILNKATDTAPKVIQHQTFYLAADGRQRHETTPVATGKTTVEITLWAEHRQIMLDLQTKQATIQPAVTPPLPPTGRMGRMVVPQSQTDLGTKIVRGLTLHGRLFMMPYPQGNMRTEVWDYRSPDFPPVIVEMSTDSPIETEDERIVEVSNVLVPASIFEVPADFVQISGIGDGAGRGLTPMASTARLLEQLAAAEAKWAASKPQAYEFHIEQICFCGPIPPGWEPIVFRVEDGMPTLVSGARAFAFRKYVENYNTVEKQFGYIRDEIAKHDYRVEVDYDADSGYPKRIFTDPAQNTADDEMTLVIEGFRVVAQW
jgi:hypothetical protein